MLDFYSILVYVLHGLYGQIQSYTDLLKHRDLARAWWHSVPPAAAPEEEGPALTEQGQRCLPAQ